MQVIWQTANYLTLQHLYNREILLSIDKEDKSLIVEGKGDCFVVPLRGTPRNDITTKFDCGWAMGLLRRCAPRNDSTTKFGCGWAMGLLRRCAPRNDSTS